MTQEHATEEVVAEATTDQSNALEHELDRLSLTQALTDFEIANARVLDLNSRLVEANSERSALQRELEVSRTAFTELNERHNAMLGSAAYRIASKIWELRNLLRA